MKRLLIFFLLTFFISASSRAQAIAPITKVGALMTKKGSVIVKEFSKTLQFKGLYNASAEFAGLTLYTPGQESAKVRGLKITIKENNRAETEGTSLLDLDEAESLSKALGYLSDVSAKWMTGGRTDYSECIFSAQDDFSTGFYHTTEGKEAAFIKCGGLRGASMYYEMSAENINAIKANIDVIITELKKK